MCRRAILKKHMKHNEYPITLTNFPRFGLKHSTIPEYPSLGPQLKSQFISDETTTQRTRYISTAKNIRARRHRKVQINVPIFRDEKTPWPFHDPSVNYNLHTYPEDDEPRKGAAKPNHIYMDAQPFGSGTCCLQVTLQARNIDEARKLYDRLIPLAPIMLALTAATPIYKGFLADTDARWNTLVGASDDRTEKEIDQKVCYLVSVHGLLPDDSSLTIEDALSQIRRQHILHLTQSPTASPAQRPHHVHPSQNQTKTHRWRHG